MSCFLVSYILRNIVEVVRPLVVSKYSYVVIERTIIRFGLGNTNHTKVMSHLLILMMFNDLDNKQEDFLLSKVIKKVQ